MLTAADSIARRVLQKAGIEGTFCALLDINMPSCWKPAAGSYSFAVQQLGLAPGEASTPFPEPIVLHPAWRCVYWAELDDTPSRSAILAPKHLEA